MKKLFFVAMAAAAMTFTACTTDKPAPANTENEQDSAKVELVSTDSIASVIEAADSTQLSALLTDAQSKIEQLKAIDPAKAKEYLASLQALLKENAEKIKAFAGTGAVATVIDAVNSLPEIEVPNVADAAAEAVEGAAEDVKDAAEGTVNDAKEAVDNVKEAAGEAAQNVKDAAAEKVSNAAEKVEAAKDAAVDKAANSIDAAADKAKGLLGK